MSCYNSGSQWFEKQCPKERTEFLDHMEVCSRLQSCDKASQKGQMSTAVINTPKEYSYNIEVY